MKKATFIAAALAAGVAGSAVALPNNVQIGAGGSTLNLRAYDFSATVFGGAPQGEFTTTSLASVHDVLNAGGITTKNWITVVVGYVDTDGVAGADETAMFWLIDDQNNPSGGSGPAIPDTYIDFNTSINVTSGAIEWINDIGDGLTTQDFGGTALALGEFGWDDSGTGEYGDAFAWSGLANRDSGSFSFSNIDGWSGFEGIQFVSYNGPTNGWSVEQTFTPGGAFQSFSFLVIPVPPAALIGLAGLAGVGVMRRRIAG